MSLESLKIITFSVLAACVYGIAHNVATAHICVEYFLPPMKPVIVLPTILPATNPFLLALVWGIVATWWAGLLFGIPLAIVCRFGSKPKLTAKNVVRPVLLLLLLLYVASMLLGIVGYIAGQMGWAWLLSPFAEAVAPERHSLFLFNLWSHNAAYLLGAIGGIVLLFRLWKRRSAIPLF